MSRKETKFYLKALIIVLALLMLISYSAFEIWNYATGPKISILIPVDGSVVSESLITIEGQSKNTQEITLNDRQILTDQKGNFSEKILLSYGYNVIEIEAKDRFGKEIKQELQLVYK